MGFGQAISACFSNYANFNGRARRSEFWWFWLFVVIVQVVVQTLFAVIVGTDSALYSLLAFVLAIVLAIPLYAAGARRLHDTGKSGWLQLLEALRRRLVVTGALRRATAAEGYFFRASVLLTH